MAPVYLGAPLYRSPMIVPAASPFERFQDLEGAVFAYSDPDSNSGYLVPRAILRDAGLDPHRFFRFTFFTFSHAETVQAIAERVADGGAVDSYVYDMLGRQSPETVARTRVIHRSAQFGFPPMVTRRDLAPDVRGRLRDALVGMAEDADGRGILGALGLDGFAEVSPALYDTIRENAARLGQGPTVGEVRGG